MFLALPIPITILDLVSARLEANWALLGATIAGLAGAEVEARGSLLQSALGNLTPGPADGGLPMAHLLAVVGWWKDSGRAAASAKPLGAPSASFPGPSRPSWSL